jgi:hypothetical protein
LFGEFCGAMAERYRGRIGAYEVWNEPNLAREWGNEPPDPAASQPSVRLFGSPPCATPAATTRWNRVPA